MRSFLMTDDEILLIATYRQLSEAHQDIMRDSILELAAPEVAPLPHSPVSPGTPIAA